ncbi:MAG: chromosome segregation protein SMC [Planctomycetales bacterium]|nr:chromosome segregation protein SMC [Planctomycetales bacterium]
MLIALELAGFKSFADKTRFDFPDGITVIVGPNGSGKSNVVDAIKWVLGAQSAKALRGKDMADVIFKGSSALGRKPANSAEATLVFDNRERRLQLDAEEVHVTRRVYRSGESEYLINGASCRLKDIRDLFRGTGVGVDAYSLIEQGKVDRMLQASPKDRRVIFEEAAGISRFNAKKAEALRRLQRVDQNLVRLKDIVDEVHTRLSALKTQASKAQRYREMTNRLHELRLQLGWTEYSALMNKKTLAESRLSELTSLQIHKQEEQQAARHEAQQSEIALHEVARSCQDVETLLQDTLQRIAVNDSQRSSLSKRIEETQSEQRRQESRLLVLRHRASFLQEEVATLRDRMDDAQRVYDAALARTTLATQQVEELRKNRNNCGHQYDSLRSNHLAYLRSSSELSSAVAQQRNLLAELVQSIGSSETQIHELGNAEQQARRIAEQSAVRLKQIHEQYQSLSQSKEKSKNQLDELRKQLVANQELAAGLNGRLVGAAERLSILEQLQQHLEGVDAGARYILDLVNQGAFPELEGVVGLVGELIEVDVHIAPLIDTALGASANALALRDGKFIDAVRNGKWEIPGRLSLMRLDQIPQRRLGEKIQLDGVRGVIGRADRLVQCAEGVEPLMRYLLGTTWLVESLDMALDLAHFRGSGLRFVTAECQVLEADGTLTIGALQSASGLVSRRSEIHNAKLEIIELKKQYQSSQGEIERLQGRVAKSLPILEQQEAQLTSLSKELSHQQAAAQAAVSKLDGIETQRTRMETVLSELNSRRLGVEPSIAKADDELRQTQLRIDELEAELATAGTQLKQFEMQVSEATDELTSAKVDLARVEQRLEANMAAYEQSTRNQAERTQAVVEAIEELQRLRMRREQSELEILNLTSQIAVDFLISEQEEFRLVGLAEQAQSLRAVRSTATKRLENVSRELEKVSHQCQVLTTDALRHQEAMEQLVRRFADDYQVEFNDLAAAQIVSDSAELNELDKEATKLRQDVASIGEINMAALAELDELQGRYDYLNGQYEDLQAAKESLQRIINKINADSRRLFLETLEVIRENFQKLYRKSFGGGNADIVLDGDDVLECGIDIIATPPGKTALSNSLLSGGEKALTAVALLLAIFQYRPSPFCVLDEVDAPFDEANIGRFVSVLTEFLDWTKFIIVTHSKKTMTAATTLYGVTMQESGVSKQVAVRFEDVNDKGEILTEKEPLRRAA